MSRKKSNLAYEIRLFETALGAIKPGPNTPKKKHDSMIKKAKWHFYYHSVNSGTTFELALKESLLIACRGDQKRYEFAINFANSQISPKPESSILSKIASMGAILKRN